MRNRIDATALALLLVSFGCVHTQPLGPLQELPEHALLFARAIGSPDYGREVEVTPDSEALAAMVLSTVPDELANRVEHEPALDGVAAVVAQIIQKERRELADPVVEQLIWHAGVAAEFLGYAPALASGAASAQFFEQHLRSIQWPEDLDLVFGVARQTGNSSVQVLVIASRQVVMRELPRTVDAGAELLIAGRLASAFDDLTLLVDDDRSRVRKVQVTTDADGGFEVRVPMPSQPGRRMLEWTGLDERGWRSSLLAFPIYVGVPLPSDPEHPLTSEVPNPEELSEWEGVVLTRINSLREEAGHRPLSPHPVASRIASRQAKAFAEDPLTQPAALFEELNAAGVRTRDVFEYRGTTYNLDARVSRALERPSIREMLLRPSMSRLSVAFASQPDGGWADTWILTEVLQAFDAGGVAALLFRDLNRQRARREAPELERVPELDAIAQAYAERACAEDPDAMAFLEGEARALQGFVIRGFQVLTSSILHPSVMREAFDDPPTANNLLSTQRHMGVGACEKGQVGDPDNEWVVFMFADSAR